MKFLKFFASLTVATAMMAFVVACNDDDDEPKSEPTPDGETLSVSPTSVSFEVSGGSQTVTVTANAAWTVDAPAWVTVSPTSGSSNATVTLTAESNYDEEGSEAREGVVTFSLTSGEIDVDVTVSQDGNEPSEEPGSEEETISVNPTSFAFEVEGGTGSISVTATGAWTASSNSTWAEIDTTAGDGDATVTIAVQGQYSADGSNTRTCSIAFTLNSSGDSATVFISQEGNEAEARPNPSEEAGVYFYDDFEWLADCGFTNYNEIFDGVEQNKPGDSKMNFKTCTTEDGQNAYEIFTEKGYEFFGVDSKGAALSESDLMTYCYVMKWYLRMGASGYQTGVSFPLNIEQEVSDAPVILTFDWASCCIENGNQDGVLMSVYLVNDGIEELIYTTPDPGVANKVMEWTSETVDLSELTFTPNTRLMFRNSDASWGASGRKRWVLDNVLLYNANIYNPEG